MIPPVFIDDGYDGSWAEALAFPNSALRVLDDPLSKLPDADGTQIAPAIVSRREGLDPFLEAPPARVLCPFHANGVNNV